MQPVGFVSSSDTHSSSKARSLGSHHSSILRQIGKSAHNVFYQEPATPVPTVFSQSVFIHNLRNVASAKKILSLVPTSRRARIPSQLLSAQCHPAFIERCTRTKRSASTGPPWANLASGRSPQNPGYQTVIFPGVPGNAREHDMARDRPGERDLQVRQPRATQRWPEPERVEGALLRVVRGLESAGLGHDLADNETYDAAWPVISNSEAIRVDQAYDGDAGRLIASADATRR